MEMLFPKGKKNTSQKPVKLDGSDLLVLKELASFFRSVDFQGSQLEALLLARASQPSLLAENADRIIPSILTPSPVVNPSSASESEANDSGTKTPTAQSSRPSVSEAEPGASSTRSETRPPTRPVVVDNSFQNTNIDETNINNFSYCGEETGYGHLEDNSFTSAEINDSDICHRSFNNNVGCFTTSNTVTTWR